MKCCSLCLANQPAPCRSPTHPPTRPLAPPARPPACPAARPPLVSCVRPCPNVVPSRLVSWLCAEELLPPKSPTLALGCGPGGGRRAGGGEDHCCFQGWAERVGNGRLDAGAIPWLHESVPHTSAVQRTATAGPPASHEASQLAGRPARGKQPASKAMHRGEATHDTHASYCSNT